MKLFILKYPKRPSILALIFLILQFFKFSWFSIFILIFIDIVSDWIMLIFWFTQVQYRLIIFDHAFFLNGIETCYRLRLFLFHGLVVVEVGEAQCYKEVSKGENELIYRRDIVNLDWRLHIVNSIYLFRGAIHQEGGNI